MDNSIKEVSLREVFMIIGQYLKLIRKFWLWLLVAALLMAGFFAYQAKMARVDFEAPLTFVVNENSSPDAKVGGILGQFGLGGGGGGYNLQKILALAESQKIINELLLDSVVVDNESDKIGNHIIEHYELVEDWELDQPQKLMGDSLQNLSINEKRLLKQLYRFILNKNEGLLRFSSDIETGILSIKTKAVNEELSLQLAENIYQRLSDFYTLESVGSSLSSVRKLQYKADSIKKALDRADYSLAVSFDRSQGVTQRVDLVRQAQLNREVQILSLAYGEVLQSLEKANFLLSNNTPFFQTVDEPFLPLAIARENWVEQGLLGFFLGGFLMFVFFAIRKFYLDVMNKESDDEIRTSADAPV